MLMESAVAALLVLNAGLLLMVVVLTFVIAVHELGHAAAARAVGVPIQVVQIGFGPSLMSFWWRGTLVHWRLIPLFGYVRPYVLRPSELRRARDRLAGALAVPSVDPDEEPRSAAETVIRPARVAYQFGGVAANFLLAVSLVWIGVAPADPLGALTRVASACGEVLVALPELLAGLVVPGIAVPGAPDLLRGMVGAGEVAVPLAVTVAAINVFFVAFNLLPLPPLDGFSCLKTGVEGILRRDLPRRWLAPILAGGFLLLAVLTVLGLISALRGGV
jgi:membrane-associated protease RseP (regulator of RpoE activity)